MGPIHQLVPDRKLLDPNFDGYKLSLSPIAIYKREIEGVDVVEPNDDQYSFLHQKEFILHNHLCGDLWNPGVVYFLNSSKKVVRCAINEELLNLESCEEVWGIGEGDSDSWQRRPGDYNLSIHFPEKELAIFADGIDTLFILETSSRSLATKWKVLHQEKVIPEGQRGFKVVDSRCQGETPEKSVVCILRAVQAHKSDTCNGTSSTAVNTSKFQTILYFVRFLEDVSETWKLDEIKDLRGPGNVEYCAVEPGGEAVYVAGEVNFEFPSDPTSGEEEPEGEAKYCWQQNFEDLKIWFDLPEGTEKSDVGVVSTDTDITITYKNNCLLNGKLTHNVQSELTTWTIEDKRLEVVIQKLVDDGMWQGLVAGDKSGKEIVDENLVNEIHNKLSHLCSEKQENGEGSTPLVNSSQLEECDAFESESRILARIDVRTMRSSHKVMVGGQQWLFNLPLDPKKALAFCVRNDVDGCVWQPEAPRTTDTSTTTSDWPCLHVGTFLAFGYVQASKTQKKFTLAPPDMSYIAIVDTTGHVIVYRRGIEVTGALRNRKTGRHVSQIANQQLVNLQTGQGVALLGGIATQRFIFILTSDKMYALHVATEEKL